jgi:hypothetical protein
MYLKLTDALFMSVDAVTEAAYADLPAAKRPKLYSATSKEVKAYLAAQEESAKPKRVTMRQARLALLKAGLLDNVQDIVANMPGAEGAAARIEWEYSSEILRAQPLVSQLGAALKLTPADLDALFLSASTL